MNKVSDLLLDVENLEVTYSKSIAAVRGVSLYVKSREIVSLFGPNGAGKTTTLRGITGFADHEHASITSGSVLLNGVDVVKMAPQQRARAGLGIIPESHKIFERLTVGEHFRTMFTTKEGPDEEKILNLFPRLKDRWAKMAGLLSGGERQMLAFAMTLSKKPSVLLIDELSLGLAPKIIDELLEKLLEIKENENIGILLVEQNIEKALAISDRCYFISSGKITRTETAMSLRNSPEIWEFMLGSEEKETKK
jgi:branched-chain amino acid transport system ATP-binding protein